MATEYNTKRICFRHLGKNNSNPKSVVFKPIKAMPISGKEPPYSSKTVLKKAT